MPEVSGRNTYMGDYLDYMQEVSRIEKKKIL